MKSERKALYAKVSGRLFVSPLVFAFGLLLVEACMSSVSAKGTTSLNVYEFTGVLEFRGSLQFNLHDKLNGSSTWLELGQTRHDITLSDWDAESQTVVINNPDGKRRRVKLKESNILSLQTRTKAEILADPVVAARNRRMAKVSESVATDHLVGFVLAQERRQKRLEEQRQRQLRRASR